jgi:ergothioneine biosynthesis protein EgtB
MLMETKVAVEVPELKFTSRYAQVRQQTEELCATLSPEDCMVQAMPDASPVKWHLAHTSWFFETFLLTPFLKSYQPINPDYKFLFNSYYNAVGERPLRANRGVMSRPSFEAVRAYRRHVDEAMMKLLEHPSANVAEIAEIGLNHEQQHQELIVTDVKYALWSNPLKPAYVPQATTSQTVSAPLRWLDFDGGIVGIGHKEAGFCFDNELPRHEQLLQPYELASRLITNAEYLEFMHAGGYERPELWLSDGWDLVQTQNWRAPLYWEHKDGEWHYYTCMGMRPVAEDLAVPVAHVSYYEADAYARWAGARLATEAEWEQAASREAEVAGNFLEERSFHPVAESDESHLFGNLWQWTQSAYLPYPGYRPAEGALGEYNGKFMCNQFVLRGGSCATPQAHIRASYRNFFPPATRWQFTGIRLAR